MFGQSLNKTSKCKAPSLFLLAGKQNGTLRKDASKIFDFFWRQFDFRMPLILELRHRVLAQVAALRGAGYDPSGFRFLALNIH